MREGQASGQCSACSLNSARPHLVYRAPAVSTATVNHVELSAQTFHMVVLLRYTERTPIHKPRSNAITDLGEGVTHAIFLRPSTPTSCQLWKKIRQRLRRTWSHCW